MVPFQGGRCPYDSKTVAPEGALLATTANTPSGLLCPACSIEGLDGCIKQPTPKVWLVAKQHRPLGRADLEPMLAPFNPSRQVQMRQYDTICVLSVSMPRKKCSYLGSHGIYCISFYPKLCVLSCNKQITSLVLHIFTHEISFQFFLCLSVKCLAKCCIKQKLSQG